MMADPKHIPAKHQLNFLLEKIAFGYSSVLPCFELISTAYQKT